MINVLFVCMGNICRSPTAQVIFENEVEKENIADKFFIDSAGTHAADGHSPDQQAKQVAKNHGLRMDHLLTRQITLHDFIFFDYIVAMDQDNLANLMSICPKSQQPKISLLLSFSPETDSLDVPDPYRGGEKGFENVFQMISLAAADLLNSIREERHL